MAEPDKEELRREVVTALKDLLDRQQITWEYMKNDVAAASEKFMTARIELLEARVRELATTEYPTLLESILGLAMTVVPVGRIVEGLTRHWTRTMELGRVVGVFHAPAPKMTKSRLAELMAGREDPAEKWRGQLRKPKEEFVRETSEYNGRMSKFTEVYAPEIEDSLRAVVKSAASSFAQPIVGQAELFDAKTSPRPTVARFDSTDLLKSFRDWIVRSQTADHRALQDVLDEAQKTEDLDQLKAGKKFVGREALNPSGLNKSYDRRAFQYFVEVCLWCTTWDLRPRFQGAQRANPIVGRGYTPPQLVPPPLGDKFWKFAVDRYYDPFFGDGTKTYAQIGRTKQLGAVPPRSLDPEVRRYIQSGASDAGFYPAERFAFHCGNVIAPELLSLNLQIAQLLERRGVTERTHSTPTELDIFYQYLLGLKKVDS